MSGAKNESALIPVPRVSGRPIPLAGNDIDTDRIIPARFMTAITFDGLGELAFRDARFGQDGAELPHPMNDPRFRAKGPRVAVVNKNFGCGSSREHAPQALMRWGVRAIVGESFADIFFGNCVALGLPAVTLPGAELDRLMDAVELDPTQELVLDLAAGTLTSRIGVQRIAMPDGARRQLLEGNWDATAVLLEARDAIQATAARLPYVGGF